ncbi:MAG: molybdopterin-guanine dinucleotide biosynthesis protein B, partial [Blautia sp.]|nr:molybdopterin-guanine dinucleotide biosynthesis protein B [Blautia sp.]
MQDTGMQNMSEIPGIGILAGGKSSRMGCNKALLPVYGEPMIQRLLHVFRDYPEVVISASAGQYEDCGRPVVYDEAQGIGPVEGICRILENTTRSHVFLCAVDMPFVTAELVSCLMEKVSEEFDCVCITEDGRIHPLCAVYAKRALGFLKRRKDEGCYRLTQLVKEMRTCFLPLEESGLPLNSAENINDPDDYRNLCDPFVFCVSGIKNSGKTSLIEQLIPYFSEDGLRVGVIKHDGHDFNIDHEGTDSDRFSRAGAAVSAICSDTKYAVVAHKPPKIEELLSHCTDLDIVIIEGMKYSDWPKVEV